MQSTSEVSARLTVKVTPEDYEAKVREELKKISRTHTIPGFRKGHVPMGDLMRRFGRDVTSEVINDEVFHAVTKYISDNKLQVLGQPMPVEVKAIDPKEAKDYTFEYDIALAPAISLELDKEVEIPYYNMEITPDMIAEQDAAICRRYGAQVPGEVTEPDALVKGALMELDAEGKVREDAEAIQVVSGIVGPKFFNNADEAAKFADKKVGDKVVFNPWNSCNGNVAELASMLQIPKETAGDVHSDFELAISEIIVVRPAEHGQELYDEVFGKDKVSTEEEYLEQVRRMVEGSFKAQSEYLFSVDARQVILDKVGELQLPDELLKRWLVVSNKDVTAEQVEAEYAGMRPEFIWQLVSDEIARKLDVKVTKENIEEAARGMAARQFAQYGMTNMDMETINNFAQRLLEDREWSQRLSQQVANAKLFDAIKQVVTVKEVSLPKDEFEAKFK